MGNLEKRIARKMLRKTRNEIDKKIERGIGLENEM
jgi:hypothetical protein